MYITTESVKTENASVRSFGKVLSLCVFLNSYGQIDGGKKIAIQATGAVSWRRQDIKYRKNKAFIDVVESVNLLMNSEGKICWRKV